MHVTLNATQGPATGMKIVVRPGQKARIGRTRWADFCIAGDSEMSEIHFAIECDWNGGRIHDLTGREGTAVNGEKIAESPLHTGDVITAGQTKFSVEVEGQPAPAASAAEQSSKIGPDKAIYFGSQLELSEDAENLLDDEITPPAFVDLLAAQELFPDALRFLAFWLPKPAAVRWAADCVREVLGVGERSTPKDQAALEAARRWADEPTEENRRSAEAAADALKFSGAAAFVALGAFWSGGSLAPADLPPVPPADTLTAKALPAALLMAASQGDPSKTVPRYRHFIAEGKKQAMAAWAENAAENG